MKTVYSMMMAAIAVSCTSTDAADLQGLTRGTPDIKSADVLAFGPEDILLIGDNKSAAVFAVATGNKEGDASKASIKVDDLAKKISDVVGGTATIKDVAANPRTGNVFAAVSVDGRPAIVQIDGAGKISELSLKDVRFSVATLSDAPEDKVLGEGRRQRNNRNDTITDLAWYEGKVMISGLRNSGSPSGLRELVFPFAASDRGVSVEIYHAAHGKDEDYAAARTFVPMMIDGQPSVLAAYVCTPLVKIPIKEIEGSAEKVRGTTIAELGNRNQPLDMFSYEKDGSTHLLLSNSARGVMKITTEGLNANKGLTTPVGGGGTAGQSFETIASLQGVVQMDKLNDSHAVVLIKTESGSLNLSTVALP